MIPPGTARFLLRSAAPALATGLLLLPSPAPAQEEGPDNSDVTMLVHLVPKEELRRVNCFHHGVETAQDVVVQGEVSKDPEVPREYMAFLLLAGFDKDVGLTAVQFGIAYDPEEKSGVDVLGWQDCAALEWHADDWPGAGTGNLLTWNMQEECQHEEPVVVGMLEIQVWGPDRLMIIPRPVDNQALIAACTESGSPNAPTAEFQPENLGFAGFGDKRGYNPWDPKQNLLKLKEKGFGQDED